MIRRAITFSQPSGDGHYYFREAKPRDVSPDVLRIGRAAATLCREELGVAFELRWIYPTTRKEGADIVRRRSNIGGLATGSEHLVRVRADVPAKDAAYVIAHESRHHWQLARWTAPLRCDAAALERWEDDANEWAADFIRRRWPIEPADVERSRANITADVAGIMEQLAALNRQLERSLTTR